ncbi:hypothetical protein TNCV_2974841 [Trichonephila clavipes]|nr:hypothetical protein TNCV_2974841 [Trichonephila clavipes]
MFSIRQSGVVVEYVRRYSLEQGWRTSGKRSVDGTRHNILGTPPMKTEKWHVDPKRFATPGLEVRTHSSSLPPPRQLALVSPIVPPPFGLPRHQTCVCLKEVVSLDRKRQFGQIGESLVIWVEEMWPIEDAGKDAFTMADFSFMMVPVDLGPQQIAKTD